jgi:ribonucleotide reductase beta subunit family protein with ferritin-like domain
MSLFPIKYYDLWTHYKNHLSVFWIVEEVDLSRDLKDWNKLLPQEKFFLKHILAFFAGSDSLVQENLAARFLNEVSYPEAKSFYSVQILMENVHSEMYSLLIDTYIEDSREKTHLLNAIEEIPIVKKKALFAKKYIQSSDCFSTRLIAFLCMEGIFFSGSFCAIYWIKQRGLMPGLTLSNEFISRDEGLHTDFAVSLYKYCQKLPVDKVWKIFVEAVSIECEFICTALQCSLIGMNNLLMSQYIQFVADRLLVQLGYSKLFNSPNPFDFMERISLESKTNFFESRNSSYGKSGVGKTQEQMEFKMDSDF